MPEFAKPDDFSFSVDKRRELRALRDHREARGVPEKRDDRLLIATWNIANFEVQDREPAHLDLIAEVVGWFDLIAVQEIRDDVTGLRGLKERLPRQWQILFSEAARQRRAPGLHLRLEQGGGGGEGGQAHRPAAEPRARGRRGVPRL